ncbi:hypothetical protein E4U42_002936 [Claviceps africana]|uniref:Uncharacterized protein n=1 Tax=Claviceps africana TaxID=83212 RepID=A0A8K0NJE3_9HYPO|nr:hypothetical protein E4U42_002936 [Claviceps africana]
MQPLASVLAALAMVAAAEACQCQMPDGKDHPRATVECCYRVGAVMNFASCPNNEMNTRMQFLAFKACCRQWKVNSNCHATPE